MYKAEVLGKLPVMQHFLFGSILPLSLPESLIQSSTISPDDPHYGHSHAHVPGAGVTSVAGGGASQHEVGWGDCCGIPVPSVFAQAEDEKRKALGNLGGPDAKKPIFQLGGNVRPVPFD